MPIETLDSILDEIADQLIHGGSHSTTIVPCMCRACFTSDLKARIQEAVAAEDVITSLKFVESLQLRHKSKLVAPLMKRLKGAAAGRFARQLRAIKHGKKSRRFHDGSFQRTFTKTTDAAYRRGAQYVAGTLGVLKEASYTTKRVPAGYLRKAETVESELDATTADRIEAIRAANPDVKGDALLKLIAAEFAGFIAARADMIATHEISQAFHNGGDDIAKIVDGEGGGITKTWQTEDEPCEECAENEEAGAVGIDEDFPNFGPHPPGHPNCRCSIEYGRAGETE